MTLTTRLTEMLKIDNPILLAPMDMVADARLTAAVSAAGGLGILGGGYGNREWLTRELDLLASECLRAGVWEGLAPAELAACVSALVYEARVGDDALAPKLPSGRAKAALGEMVRIWGRLDALEEEFRISQTEGVGQREPDLGFAWAAYEWASGKGLDEVLREAEMPAGDFVRWCKQVIDVLGQISAAAPVSGTKDSTVAKNARKAVDGLLRGVVAYSSVG